MLMSRPKLVRDWAGGYVKCTRPIKNGMAEMPAGTIFQVESAGITAHFKALPCKCCGVQMRYTSKGKDKFGSLQWLGYEPPKEAVTC